MHRVFDVIARTAVLCVAAATLHGQVTTGLDTVRAGTLSARHENSLIARADSALGARDWRGAEPVLRELTALDPRRWQYLRALGDVAVALGEYDSATSICARGIAIADSVGRAPSDTALVRSGLGHMLLTQGNAYLKLHRSSDALASYTRAATIDPNPGRAYFNLCATFYNTGDADGALSACDKAIAADSTRADAYFIRGSLLLANATTDPVTQKVVAPAGTVQALRRYLALAPDGTHANDVKQMLVFLGVTP